MAAYNNPARLASVENDHIVSLGLGGAPNDPANLYPEPNYPGGSPDSYYHNPKGFVSRVASSFTFDVGGENGDGLSFDGKSGEGPRGERRHGVVAHDYLGEERPRSVRDHVWRQGARVA